MNRYGKRCVLYPRVSTEMQVDGYSLEGQKNMLTRFADREEMIVVDTYEDAGKSGKSIEGRPAFQKMLRDIEDGLDIDYILVYKLSRFGRNAADILNSLELVQSYGVNLICIEEGIDSSQTSGKLLISVLSAVAEIERENIIEQTMNGRREKARQGGWNGGFAPYGYTLEDNKLMIEETEAVAIRKIFELYTSSEIGLGGIANQLNLQGIRKIPRQNGTLEDWTGHFIKLILDNPVYCGKIAYGRRTKEKVKGTKNDYQMKRNDDYILTEGQHKGIVSEEVWEKAHAKCLRTGVKQPSKIGRDRVHLLSGLLKCPVCGSPMYTNKHAWTNKDGTYKEIYYYVCSRNRMVRGKHCEYKAMLKKTDIEPMVIEAIREIVRNEEYAQAIKKRIGVQIVRFSPVHDKHLPDDLDGLLLGGGYPELYAKALEENETIRNEIRRKAEEDMPILAECGGYLYLLKELKDENGTGYEMAGVFSGKGYKKGKNSHFGYITVQTERDSLYLKAGETIKGHEFHYWESTQDENELKMQAKKPTGKRSWPCVTVKNQVMAGFPHLYYPSLEGFGERFVQACDRYRMKRKRQQ